MSVLLVFAVLPNKSEETYVRLLRELKKLEPSLAPETITTDSKKAMLNAFRAEFLNTRQKGL